MRLPSQEGDAMWWNRRTRIDRWSAREVQQLLRQFGAEARDLAAVMAVLGVSQMEAHRMLNELSRAGYVARDPASVDEPRWHRTREGDEFAETGLGPPLSRARAERLLQRVIRRVVTVNRQPHFLCRVTAVGVCGAYRTEAPVLEALELVVRIVPKPPAPGTANAVFRPDRRLPYWDLQKQLPPTNGPTGGSATWNCTFWPGNGASSCTAWTIGSSAGSTCGWCSWRCRMAR